MKVNYFSYLFILLLISNNITQAQWVQTNGPFGGTVFSLGVNPNGDIYAGTNNGFLYSRNNGNTWHPVQNFLSTHHVTTLLVDSGHIFAGTNGNGLYRSTDNAGTWNQLIGLPNGISSLEINNSGHIYAGTGNGVYRSTDNGDNWTSINSGLVFSNVVSLAINSNDNIFATTSNPNYGNAICRSTDNGDTWTQIGNGLSGYPEKIIINKSSGYIFVSAFVWPSYKIFRSMNNGENWDEAVGGFRGPISFTINSDGYILLGTTNGVYRSLNNGTSWSQTGLTNGYVRCFAINNSGQILAGTDASGVFISSDKGSNWNKMAMRNSTVYSLAVNDQGHIFAGTAGDGIFRSSDNGNNWTQIDNGSLVNTSIYSIVINRDDDIYLGTFGEGIFRSIDNGNNWTQINNGLTNKNIGSLAISPNGFIFAGCIAGSGGIWGIYRSTDNGDNWIQVGSVNTSISILASNKSGDIFAGTAGSGVFRSTDNGNNWTPINNGLADLQISALSINNNGDVIVGANGVFRSIDNGSNWSQVGSVTSVSALTIDSNSNIFAGTWGSGMYFSTNNGESWIQKNEGLTNYNIYSLKINSTSKSLFMGTYGSGVWRLPLLESEPIDFNMFLTEKQNIINSINTIDRPFFHYTKPFYEEAETHALNYLNTIINNYNDLDGESIARLTLSERLSVQSLIDAIDISKYGAKGLRALTISKILSTAFKYLGDKISKVPVVGSSSNILYKAGSKIDEGIYKLSLAFKNSFRIPTGQISFDQYLSAENTSEIFLNEGFEEVRKKTLEEVDNLFDTDLFDKADHIIQDYVYLSTLELQTKDKQLEAVDKAKSHDYGANTFNLVNDKSAQLLSNMIASNLGAKNVGEFTNTLNEYSSWGVIIGLLIGIIASILLAIGSGGTSLLLALGGIGIFMVKFGSLVATTTSVIEAGGAAGYVNLVLPYVYIEPSIQNAFDTNNNIDNSERFTPKNRLQTNKFIITENLSDSAFSNYLERFRNLLISNDPSWSTTGIDSLNYFLDINRRNNYSTIGTFLSTGDTSSAVIPDYINLVNQYIVKTSANEFYSAGIEVMALLKNYNVLSDEDLQNTVTFIDSASQNIITNDVLAKNINNSLVENNITSLPVVGIDQINYERVDTIFFDVYLTIEVINYSSSNVSDLSISLVLNSDSGKIIGDSVFIFNINGYEKKNFRFTLSSNSDISGAAYLKSKQNEVNAYLLPSKEFLINRSYLSTGILDINSAPIINTIYQNYPNPFNPITTIKYTVAQTCIIKIQVYDMLGSEITTLVSEEKVAGNYEVNFNGSNLSSGVYFYRIQAGSFTDTKKFVLIK